VVLTPAVREKILVTLCQTLPLAVFHLTNSPIGLIYEFGNTHARELYPLTTKRPMRRRVLFCSSVMCLCWYLALRLQHVAVLHEAISNGCRVQQVDCTFEFSCQGQNVFPLSVRPWLQDQGSSSNVRLNVSLHNKVEQPESNTCIMAEAYKIQKKTPFNHLSARYKQIHKNSGTSSSPRQ